MELPGQLHVLTVTALRLFECTSRHPECLSDNPAESASNNIDMDIDHAYVDSPCGCDNRQIHPDACGGNGFIVAASQVSISGLRGLLQ